MKLAAKEMRLDFKSEMEIAIANQGLFNFLDNLSKFKFYEMEKAEAIKSG